MTVSSNPKVNITKAPASTTQDNGPQRVLIVGQQTGSVYTSGALVKDVSNGNAETDNFGKDSHITSMVKAYKAINQLTAIDAIPLDDAVGAVKATGTIAFTGTTASAAGTITVAVGSKKKHSYNIAVAIGDTPTVIGAALLALIAADEFAIVSGINTVGSVALTAINGGTIGNGIGLSVVGTVAGITNSAIVAMASGATDPTITTLFDVVGNKRYQTIIFPGAYDQDVLTDFLDPRWNVENNILDGVGIISKTDTLSNLKAFATVENTQSLIVHANSAETAGDFYKGSAIFELDDVISSEVGAIRALRLTDGANIAAYVISSNLDVIGGVSKASLPYFNTPMFDLPIIDTDKGFTQTEIDELVVTGAFVIGNNIAGNTVILDEFVTTYKTDAAGNLDPTYKFLNRVDTLSGIAEFNFNNLRADFAQYRLTNGRIIPNYNNVGVDGIRAALKRYYQILSGPGYLLTRAGQSNIDFFMDNLTITLDLADGKVTSIAKVPLVSQLRQMDLVLQAVID